MQLFRKYGNLSVSWEGQMQFAPTITGHPNKIGFTGKIYPEHLVLKQDLQDFEDYIERLWFGGNGS